MRHSTFAVKLGLAAASAMLCAATASAQPGPLASPFSLSPSAHPTVRAAIGPGASSVGGRCGEAGDRAEPGHSGRAAQSADPGHRHRPDARLVGADADVQHHQQFDRHAGHQRVRGRAEQGHRRAVRHHVRSHAAAALRRELQRVVGQLPRDVHQLLQQLRARAPHRPVAECHATAAAQFQGRQRPPAAGHRPEACARAPT